MSFTGGPGAMDGRRLSVLRVRRSPCGRPNTKRHLRPNQKSQRDPVPEPPVKGRVAWLSLLINWTILSAVLAAIGLVWSLINDGHSTWQNSLSGWLFIPLGICIAIWLPVWFFGFLYYGWKTMSGAVDAATTPIPESEGDRGPAPGRGIQPHYR